MNEPFGEMVSDIAGFFFQISVAVGVQTTGSVDKINVLCFDIKK